MKAINVIQKNSSKIKTGGRLVKKGIYLLSLSILFFSCVKDKPEDLVAPVVQLSSAKKVYVVNEGNYGSGNASFTLYDPQTDQTISDLYSAQNAGSAGDVAQSMNFIQNRFYLVINNSKKVIVCDAQFKKTGQIDGLTSPRYFLAITNQKAYVSDLYANAISVVNLNSLTKSGSIPCSGKTEQMLMIYDKVFVCNSESNYLYVINTANDAIADSILVGFGASSLVMDKFDRIWVLSSGSSVNPGGRLTKLNPLSDKVEFYLDFPKAESPWNVCINQGKDTLFYLNNHIYRMPVSSLSLPTEPLIQKGTKNFYGLGIHPYSSHLYAADALDYSQHSTIYRYNQNGSQLGFFKAGINANGFYFE